MERRSHKLVVVLITLWLVSLAVPSFGEEKPLPAPMPISPTDQSRLQGNPRRVSFKWSKVDHAVGYGIEIVYYEGRRWSSDGGRPTRVDFLNDTGLTMDFWGDQPGAWRVWAIDRTGQPGTVSQWFLFTFAPEGTEMPAPPPDTLPDFSKMPRTPRREFPVGQMSELPLHDPDTGETCAWPNSPIPGITMPKPVYTPAPQYTDAARRAKQRGSATVAFRVGEDGLVKNVCIAMASRDDLGMSALKTVRTWRFQPAMRDGKPVPYDMSTEVTFDLK
jgi:TonB family protein